MKKEDAVVADNALVDLQRLMRTWAITEDEHRDERWREKVIQAYTTFASATGIVARDSDPYGPLDFVAKILYSYDCAMGNREPLRWSMLQADLKERFREQAIQTVASWANEELQNERIMGMDTKLKLV